MGTIDERPGPLQLGARYKASRMKQIERTLARLNTASYEVISERNTAKAALELEKAAYWDGTSRLRHRSTLTNQP